MEEIPTLQTIADLAGVSKNTVSCALRNNRRISEATRARICAVAEKVGYRPNPLVAAHMQSLRSRKPVRKTANLAFLHAFDIGDRWQRMDYTRALFEGADARAAQSGYSLDPVWLGESGMSAPRLTRMLRARGVQGLLVGPLPAGMEGLAVEWEHFASAAMGFSLRSPTLHRAGTHQFHSIEIALRELQNLGYRRIGALVSPQADERVDHAWMAGLAVAGVILQDGPSPVVLRLDDARSPRFAKWLEAKKPDVLLSAGVNHVEWALAELGVSVPGDIGLVSVQGGGETATVARDWSAIGAAAVDLVTSQLYRNERGIPAKAKTVLLEGEWRPGRTVRAIGGVRLSSGMKSHAEARRRGEEEVEIN